MIDQKIAIVTVHDINPSHAEKIFRTTDKLNAINIKYSLSVVPYYDKKYNIKDDVSFCNQLSSLLSLSSGSIELSLHGLYHQADGKIDDFDTHTKEEEKTEIQEALDIFSAAKLPRPSMFIPPAWHLSQQAIQALKELRFSFSESMTELDFIQEGKKYLLHPVMNWDQYGDMEKNKLTLKPNKDMFYNRLFNLGGRSFGFFRLSIHPPYDPDGALDDQVEMINHLREKESYRFVTYSDLLNLGQ